MAVAGVVIAGAMAASGAFRAMLWPATEGLELKPAVHALHQAVTAWYRAEQCHGGGQPVPLPLALAHEPVAADADVDAPQACKVRVGTGTVRATSCVARHLQVDLRGFLPALTVAPPRAEDPDGGTFAWEIVTRPLPPVPAPSEWRWAHPQVRVFWNPPEHLRRRVREFAEPLARELGAFCDDDGDADTAEACDGVPRATAAEAGERFVWVAPLGAQDGSNTRAPLHRRQLEWLAAHAVDCDADQHRGSGPYTPGTDVMDPFCDGPVDDERIDDSHVIDATGDGCDNARWRAPDDLEHPRLADSYPYNDWPCDSPVLLDADEDGQLDFDVTGDLVVDAADFHALGC